MNQNNGNQRERRLNLFINEGNASAPQGYEVASIGKEISFDLNALDRLCWDGWERIHYDLFALAAAVECADRHMNRGLRQLPRNFNVTLPVFNLRTWRQPEVRKLLCETLRLLTGDNWHFDFIKSDAKRKFPRQGIFPLASDKLKYAIAYSDGLDSRCVSGLYQHEEIVRVRIDGRKDHKTNDENVFDFIPFRVLHASLPESSVRSRGFKFATVTAIASHLAGVDRIIVPESGQGALGPVLLPLHNTYADYRSHPVFFRKMETFIECLLGHTVRYEQPRLWFTKGQTVQAYLEKSKGDKTSLHNTRSCWQVRWNVPRNTKLGQCGLCAACLLRRLSLHTAGVVEANETYTFAHLNKSSYKESRRPESKAQVTKTMVKYGIAGVRHLQQLADLARFPDEHLRADALEIAQSTDHSEEETLGNLKELVANHDSEWQSFVERLGETSFINDWTIGGRHD